MKSFLKNSLLATIVAITGFGVLTVSNDEVNAQSFNCSKASTQVEKMICDNPRLGELDSDLAGAYQTALRDSPWASANRRIRADQKAWIARRDRCNNAGCLRRLYQMRLGQLHAEVDVDGNDGNGALAGSGGNANPGRMMAICRDRAVHVFHIRAGDVETKYEGQRTDGTHAVNGTVFIRRHNETFQCSFNSSGSQIVQFVVN
ncbi:MAG: lysozyme inhibitor LprI family protein [Anderseniella sp.]